MAEFTEKLTTPLPSERQFGRAMQEQAQRRRRWTSMLRRLYEERAKNMRDWALFQSDRDRRMELEDRRIEHEQTMELLEKKQTFAREEREKAQEFELDMAERKRAYTRKAAEQTRIREAERLEEAAVTLEEIEEPWGAAAAKMVRAGVSPTTAVRKASANYQRQRTGALDQIYQKQEDLEDEKEEAMDDFPAPPETYESEEEYLAALCEDTPWTLEKENQLNQIKKIRAQKMKEAAEELGLEVEMEEGGGLAPDIGTRAGSPSRAEGPDVPGVRPRAYSEILKNTPSEIIKRAFYAIGKDLETEDYEKTAKQAANHIWVHYPQYRPW